MNINKQLGEAIKEIVSHNVDVITDSDWFKDLVKQKVKEIISKHKNLEKELSSGKIEPKLFAKKSKEYSNLESIISTAKEYLNFDNEKKGLEQILQDKNNDKEIKVDYISFLMVRDHVLILQILFLGI